MLLRRLVLFCLLIATPARAQPLGDMALKLFVDQRLHLSTEKWPPPEARPALA